MSPGGWFFSLLLAAAASSPMERVEFKVPGRVVSCLPADVNGDGHADLLLFWRQGVPPESRGRISVFIAKAGVLPSKARQVISLPPGTAAFDVGDADGDGRTDVILLQADGVWMLRGGADGQLEQKPRQLIKAMTLAALPDEDHVPPMELLLELDEGGRAGLLVPTVPIGPLALYARGADGAYTLLSMLRVPARAKVYSSAEDFLSARDFSSVFTVTMPRFRLLDQDGDGRRDLLCFKEDALWVFRARADGGFDPQAAFSRTFGMLTDAERIKRGVFIRGDAADFNGDGRADLVFNKASGGITNMRNETWIFMADQRGGYPARPSVRIAADGYGAFARLADVDGDGADDLVRPYVQMGIMALTQVLLSGKLDVYFHVHLSAGKRPGDKRPGVRPSFSLPSAVAVNFKSNQELSGPYPILDMDFDGDGHNDVVIGQAGGGSGANPDRLEIRPGRESGPPSGDAMWSVALPGTRYVLPYLPRPGGLPGLVIFFPLVDDKQGDVWVFQNRGAWER